MHCLAMCSVRLFLHTCKRFSNLASGFETYRVAFDVAKFIEEEVLLELANLILSFFLDVVGECPHQLIRKRGLR